MSYSLPEFLAHAVALEDEAAERYLELADIMESNRNDEVADVFRTMSRYSRMHHEDVMARVGKTPLPKLGFWQYRWVSPPEAAGDDAIDFYMAPYNALRLARDNELRGYKYYKSVADEAKDPEVKRLATDFAAEERTHVESLDKWLAVTHRPSATWESDPEPLEVA